MSKLTFADIKKNLKLFFGTFIAVSMATGIICACLNLVFSAAKATDYGHRFDNMKAVALADQYVKLEIADDDGDVEVVNEPIEGLIPLKQEAVDQLVQQHQGIPDYTFAINAKGMKYKRIAGHNFSSMLLSGLRFDGEKPKKDKVIVDSTLAKTNQLTIGDSITVMTNRGKIQLTISGIAYGEDESIFAEQSYLFFDDDYAKSMAVGCYSIGFSKVDQETIKALRSEGYQIYEGSDVNKAELPQMINSYSSMVIIFITMGALCLVISLFVISGTVQFSIRNRLRQLALLRVIGLKASQVKGILVRQTLVIALFGGIAGTFLSKPFARLIILGFSRLGIVSSDFVISHALMWVGITILAVVLLSLMVTIITARKPLSIPPLSLMKDESGSNGRLSLTSIIMGLVLVGGGVAILMFAPMVQGVGVGMGFCAASLFLAGAMCLTPLIMIVLNKLFVVIIWPLTKSLSKLVSANITMKASKFAVASVSIAIIIAMGPMMMLNNITYMKAMNQAKLNFSQGYRYVSKNMYPYDLNKEVDLGSINTKLLMLKGDKLKGVNTMVLFGELPQRELIAGDAMVSGNKVLVSERLKQYKIGGSIDVWLNNGKKMVFVVGGIYPIKGIPSEGYDMIVSYDVVKGSMFSDSLSTAYSNSPMPNGKENTLAYYQNSPEYDIQLGASALLGVIGLILSIVALFNTFALVMTVRKKEFNGLKIIGAMRSQLVRMTSLETLIVTMTGLIIGVGILILCVGLYSKANLGIFDFIVDTKLFYGTIVLSAILGFVAGYLPSVTTIAKLKRQFRNE